MDEHYKCFKEPTQSYFLMCYNGSMKICKDDFYPLKGAITSYFQGIFDGNYRKKGVAVMNAKQKRFCDEYLIDCNATQAAIRAGYSPKVAYSTGSENLEKPELKSYISEQLEKIHNEKTADATEVIEYLTSVLRGESQASIVVVEGTGDGRSKARSIDKQPDEKERLKAAELLGKRYGIFTDKVKVDGAVPVTIVDDLDKD